MTKFTCLKAVNFLKANNGASEACKTTPKFLEKMPTDLIAICRTG